MQQLAATQINTGVTSVGSTGAETASAAGLSDGTGFSNQGSQDQSSFADALAQEQNSTSNQPPALTQAQQRSNKSSSAAKPKDTIDPVKPSPERQPLDSSANTGKGNAGQQVAQDEYVKVNDSSSEELAEESKIPSALNNDLIKADAIIAGNEDVKSQLIDEALSTENHVDWLALIESADKQTLVSEEAQGQSLDEVLSESEASELAPSTSEEDTIDKIVIGDAGLDAIANWLQQLTQNGDQSDEVRQQLQEIQALVDRLSSQTQNTNTDSESASLQFIQASLTEETALPEIVTNEQNEEISLALLQTLLVDSQSAEKVNQPKASRDNLKLANEQAANTPQETNTQQDLSAVEQVLEQAAAGSTESSKELAVTQPNPVTAILKLPEPQQEAVLTHIAQQLLSAEKLSTEAAEQITPSLSQQLTLSTSAVQAEGQAKPSIADFISSLKAGLTEFKQQVESGREPGIDLKALVSDAIASLDASANNSLPNISPERIDQAVKVTMQTIELAQNMAAGNELSSHDVAKLERSLTSEVSRTEARSMQQLPAHFEKAVNITKPDGQQQLAERVRWMVGNNLQQADIRLDPPDLGSMQIKVSMHGEAASVSFVVQSQQAREMLDHAVPKLRELLGEQGIELGESFVRQESQNGGNDGTGESSGRGANGEDVDQVEDGVLIADQTVRNGHVGEIDYFV